MNATRPNAPQAMTVMNAIPAPITNATSHPALAQSIPIA
jgi:hypothetical protein